MITLKYEGAWACRRMGKPFVYTLGWRTRVECVDEAACPLATLAVVLATARLARLQRTSNGIFLAPVCLTGIDPCGRLSPHIDVSMS
jgi:hypothetical protein